VLTLVHLHAQPKSATYKIRHNGGTVITSSLLTTSLNSLLIRATAMFAIIHVANSAQTVLIKFWHRVFTVNCSFKLFFQKHDILMDKSVK